MSGSPARSLGSRSRVGTRDPRAVLASLAGPMLGILAVEFLLGMVLNLFVTLPTGGAVAILASNGFLILHILLAVALIGIGGRAVSVSVRSHERRLVGASLLALLSAVGATLAGLSFTVGPGGADASLAMSVGFIGLLVAAALLLRFAHRPVDGSERGGPGGMGSEPEV